MAAPLDWTETDDQAVDTVRVLAMDAVQKVGNGHPGTAMSLAPAAYLLFQKVMRHNPADPDWPGRDRFVLSCGHSSLTLYIQLFLGGWGLELEDLKSLRTWGSKTPGHPEYGHTAGVETTTGPLGQGVGNAVGMAMAARRERGLLDPDAAEGDSPFDHHVYALCSDGDLEEGVSAEASSIAGTQQLGNLTLIYDANQISIEDDTDVAFSEDVGARYEAYGWHVQNVDWTNDGTGYAEDVPALYAAIRTADGGHRPAQPHRPAHDHRLARAQRAEHRQGPRLRARRRGGRRHQEDPRLRPRADLRGARPTSSSTPAASSRAARTSRPRGSETSTRWTAQALRQTPDLFERMQTRTLPVGLADALPTFDADPKGVATRKASGAVINAIAAALPELWGGSADLAGVQQHHHRGRPVVPARRTARPTMFTGDPLRRPRAALRHPRARAWARS